MNRAIAVAINPITASMNLIPNHRASSIVASYLNKFGDVVLGFLHIFDTTLRVASCKIFDCVALQETLELSR